MKQDLNKDYIAQQGNHKKITLHKISQENEMVPLNFCAINIHHNHKKQNKTRNNRKTYFEQAPSQNNITQILARK